MDNDRHSAPLGDMDAMDASGTRLGAGTQGAFGAGGYDPSLTLGGLETMRPQEDGESMLLAGRYRAMRRLGEGGMGSVWLAEDLKLDGRPVAIKMLPSVLAGKKGAFRQVKQEALMAMKLSHPNIATVRAFEEDEGGIPFLVMDYIEGQGLDDFIAEKGALPVAEALKLLEPVAEALDYAHSQGVVHRDVKPANVMVRKDGTPFVLDFGIAREIQETMTRVTGKLSSGTLMYMSPEQLHGHAPKAAQDVYSFAAMAYECLGGRPPFATGQIEYRIDHDAPAPLPAGVAGEELRNGILSGLAKEPERRPESCAGVLGRGRQDGGNQAILSTVSATIRSLVLAKWGRKGRVPAYAALAVALAVAAVCWLAGGGGEAGPDGEEARGLVPEAETEAESAVYMDWVPEPDSGNADANAPKAEAGKKLAGMPSASPEQERRAGDTKVLRLPGGAAMTMVWCPAGHYVMGSPETEDGREQDERQHRVTLAKGFWLAKTEVTQRQWTSVMGTNPSHFRGDGLPVENVSWNDAREFCRKAGLQLPTEAQWEYACRAGSAGAYSGTGKLDAMGWYGEERSTGHTHPVGQKQPNAWGLEDMHGNVWEWCEDWYGPYPGAGEKNPKPPPSGDARTYRGGAWHGNAASCRSANRSFNAPSYANDYLGFRPCLEEPAGTGTLGKGP